MPDCSAKFLAKLFSLTERRIQQLALSGDMVKLSRGKYDLWPSIKGYTDFLRKQAVTEEKKLIAENRRIKELVRMQKEGELVNAKELQRELMTLFTTIKTRIRATAPKCAQEIAHLKVSKMKNKELIAAIQSILKKEHDDALQELSEWKSTKS